VTRRRVREAGCFFREGQKRIALGAAEPAARVLAQEEYHKSEYEAEADRESEGNDGHGVME
jgi:hypothetical protein